jgi:hypothetical protein
MACEYHQVSGVTEKLKRNKTRAHIFWGVLLQCCVWPIQHRMLRRLMVESFERVKMKQLPPNEALS